MGKYQNIIWDWNGTLLNDLELCLHAVNLLLVKRNIPQLTRERYLDIFAFPVKSYYSSAGFDFSKESFEVLADEFMDHYHRLVRNARLHEKAFDLINQLKLKGKSQIIVSAMQQSTLNHLVSEHGLSAYMSGVFGIENHLAGGKIGLAESAFSTTGFDKQQTCLIGDTLHDAEVARHLGIACILVSVGHQSNERLHTSGFPVAQSFNDLSALLTAK